MLNHTILTLSFVSIARAQSLIVGIPNTETTPKGEFILAHETQLNRFQSGGYWNSFTFATLGISKHVELASSVYGVSVPRSRNSSIGFGFKAAEQWTQKFEFRTSVGAMVPVSFEGQGTGYWVYGNASIRLPHSRTRFTVGPSFGTRQIFGRRTYSTMVGVEQPFNKQWGVVADWFSGRHDLGAAIAGISYMPNKKTLIIFGYKVANSATSGRPAFMIEVARTFGEPRH